LTRRPAAEGCWLVGVKSTMTVQSVPGTRPVAGQSFDLIGRNRWALPT
jgi:hypothetical protein